MNRRQLLAGTASLIGTARAWAGANDRIRVASVGLGGRGCELMKQAFKVPNVEVVAVCDPDELRMDQCAAEVEKLSGKKPRLEADVRRLLEDKSIDAVNIATCNHWHAPAAIYACQAGKHVYVEKPFRTTSGKAGSWCRPRASTIASSRAARSAAPIPTSGERSNCCAKA